MISSELSFIDHSQINIHVYKWTPDSLESPKGIVQIVHGMAEHAIRYKFLAEALTNEGYIVYAEDHRGHGKTMESKDKEGWLGPDGWDGVVKNLKQLKDTMVKEHPNLPVYLIGHSWGSFLLQDYIQRWGSELEGIIMSGTTGKQDLLNFLKIIGKMQIKKHGPNAPAGLIYKLGVEPLNKKFEPAKSPSAWLSTIEEEVQKYDDDPLCGFRPPNKYYLEMVNAMKRIWKSSNESKIPVDLPIYIITGEFDPVGKFNKNLKPLLKRYQKYGIKDVTNKIYPKARHEILNDICREEVVENIISWLDSHA